MSESGRIRQEKLSCDAVAREASVGPVVRSGIVVLFTAYLGESGNFVF